MVRRSDGPVYTCGEEIANSVTHGVGILLAVTGLAVLTAFAALRGDAWGVVGCSIFGATLVMLYTASTLYHAIQSVRVKKVMRVLDHSAIYLLIAGTYTPFTLVTLRGPWGWSLFGAVWGLALLGIVLRATLFRNLRVLPVILYVAIGWTVMIAVKPLAAALDTGGLVLLVCGGVAYTSGIVFYAWKNLPYHHAVWHGFVLGGSVLHFFAILFYVV